LEGFVVVMLESQKAERLEIKKVYFFPPSENLDIFILVSETIHNKKILALHFTNNIYFTA
jgi:hypothetical protein